MAKMRASSIETEAAITEASNPSIGGFDAANLALLGLGMGLTAGVNNSLVAPFVLRIVPTGGNATIAGLANAATTVATALGLNYAIGIVNKSAARKIMEGGLSLAVGNAILALVPGFGVPVTVPGIAGVGNIQGLLSQGEKKAEVSSSGRQYPASTWQHPATSDLAVGL